MLSFVQHVLLPRPAWHSIESGVNSFRSLLDIGGALTEKLLFNTTRADHKPEDRALADGKKY